MSQRKIGLKHKDTIEQWETLSSAMHLKGW